MFKKLKNISYEQAKNHILPNDPFLERDKKNYWKVSHTYKAMVVTTSIVLIMVMLISNFLNDYDGDLIHKKNTILTPFTPYISYLIYGLTIVAMFYFWYFFNKTDIYAHFYMKKYTLVKNLSISMIIISISISWLAFTIIADAPLGGAGIAIVLTFLSLILNFIIIYGNLSVEIGKLTEGFEKNRLQKITGNLIPFLVGNALVFYVVYKFVWAVFPNVVHGMGDSPIGVYIGIVGFPLIYSVFPLYYMGEKIINGYLVNKYYDQFKAEYDLKD